MQDDSNSIEDKITPNKDKKKKSFWQRLRAFYDKAPWWSLPK